MDPMLLLGLALLGGALLTIIIEAFVPSAGVLAAVAAVLSISGIVCLFRYDTAWGFGGIAGTAVLGPTAFITALKLWRYTPIGRRVIGEPLEEQFARQAVAEREEARSHQSLIGQEGVALTDLRPVGVVQLADRRVDALAEEGYISSGVKVRVTQSDGSQIKVRMAAAKP
jgi:membrane-bound serine protease (ClpP class)